MYTVCLHVCQETIYRKAAFAFPILVFKKSYGAINQVFRLQTQDILAPQKEFGHALNYHQCYTFRLAKEEPRGLSFNTIE